MNQRLFSMLVAILLLSGATNVRAQYPDTFFTDETRPNPLYFLYDPPVNSKTPDGEFYNDWWYYEWGKTQREYSYAVWDEDAELMSEEELGVYNDVMGIEVGDKAPEIIQLARRAVNDVVRANAFAMNRVICGHHWKSDIDAGKIEASVIFAAITGTPEYQEQLQKARAEYEKIAYPDEPASVPKTLSEKSKADGQIYDMQGRKLESLPAHAPYIHNGRKIMK